jgi:arabinose-5-phosphate isomerase
MVKLASSVPELPEIQSARRTLQIQVDGINGLIDRLDESFSRAVRMILRCEGRVVLTGMGKSGLICQKITATFASTGTPAQFLHPAEAIHGDLGIIAPKDLVIAVSYSGETEEVVRLLPTIKRFAVPLISLTGHMNSTLAKAGDVHIDIAVPREACPLGLAPTASTTATLAMGDALAVALLEARGFTAEEFATFHPGGSLGKRLLLRVEDVMHSDVHMPLVHTQVAVKDALFEITGKRMGITGVVDEEGHLVGVFTDGDLRRLITKSVSAIETPIVDVMSPLGQRIDKRELAVSALGRMEDQQITSLFVVDTRNDPDLPVGIIHLHDLLKAGIA